jgi:hypothetical protein
MDAEVQREIKLDDISKIKGFSLLLLSHNLFHCSYLSRLTFKYEVWAFHGKPVFRAAETGNQNHEAQFRK